VGEETHRERERERERDRERERRVYVSERAERGETIDEDNTVG